LHIFSIQKSIISLQNKPVKSRNLLDHNQAFWAAFTAKKANTENIRDSNDSNAENCDLGYSCYSCSFHCKAKPKPSLHNSN